MKNKKVFEILILISCLLFNIAWATAFFFISKGISYSWFLLLLLFVPAIVSFSLVTVISTSLKKIYLTFVGSTFLFFIFLKDNWLLTLFLWLISFLLVAFYARIVLFEKKQRKKIALFWFFRKSITLLTVSASVIFSGIVFFLVSNGDSGQEVKLDFLNVPREVTTTTFSLAEFLIPNEEIKWINQGATVNEYFLKSLNSQEGENEKVFQLLSNPEAQDIPLDRANLSGKKREEVNQVAIESAKKKLSSQLEMEISGDEKMIDLVHSFVNNKIKELTTSNSDFLNVIPAGLTLIIFLTLQTVFWLLRYPLIWTIMVTFSILVKLKIVTIEEKTEQIEVISE